MKNSHNIFRLLSILILAALTALPTLSMAQQKIDSIDLLWVRKKAERLYLVKNQKVLKSFGVAFGANPVGQKVKEGDERTPEGRYIISEKHAYSQFYKALLISYPTNEQKRAARKLGVDPGDNIRIHGIPTNLAFLPNFIQTMQDWINWTDGCIAVTNTEMDQIFNLVRVGMPIVIDP